MNLEKHKRFRDRESLDYLHKDRCAICNRRGCDPDHIKTKGSGGGDEWWNTWPLCRRHHTERHAKGLKYLYDRHESAQKELHARGWRFENQFGVWKLVRQG